MFRKMSLFILTLLTVYGGMHVYAFLRVRSVLGFGMGPGIALALFMLLMTTAPVLVRSLERYGFELTARAFAYLAYIWMAALFLYFCGSLVLDLIGLITRTAGWATRSDVSALLIPARTALLMSLGLSLAICVYGYFDAQNIRTERVVIETEKLPAGTNRLTIAQISDVHLGLIIRCDRLVEILEHVKAAHPDIVLSTGDLVDAQINHLGGLRELLQDIKPRYGKYAITGNHEYFAGIDKALEFTRQAGFTMLRNEAKDVGGITIAGVDDRTAVLMHEGKPVADRSVLLPLDRKKFILFLKHQPLPDPGDAGLFDLMLSGHTHRGQIWPFTYVTRMTYPLNAGDYDLGTGSLLHVSRGTGTWGPPIRFLSPPEVTIIELVRKMPV